MYQPLAKCYTFRQIIFFHNRDLQKNTFEPLQARCSLPITAVHPMLHRCNIFKENFPETGELNASETLIATSTFKNTDTES